MAYEVDIPNLFLTILSCVKNHDIETRRAVVKLPRAREKEREEDTVCSVVHNIFSRDVISEIHTRETSVSYVTKLWFFKAKLMVRDSKNLLDWKMCLWVGFFFRLHLWTPSTTTRSTGGRCTGKYTLCAIYVPHFLCAVFISTCLSERIICNSSMGLRSPSGNLKTAFVL